MTTPAVGTGTQSIDRAADLLAREDDKEALAALYRRMEFKGWLKELEEGVHRVRVEQRQRRQ